MTDQEIADRNDAERFRWLDANYLGADFRYGAPREEVCALVFEIPRETRVSSDLRSTVDTAMASPPNHTRNPKEQQK